MKKLDIGDGFKITAIGYDKNGNWRYSVSKNGSRAKPIQHTVLEYKGLTKITKDSLKEYKDGQKQTVKNIEMTFDYIKKYYNEFCVAKENSNPSFGL